MASVRVRLSDILKMDDKDIQIREAKAITEQLRLKGKSLAVAENLVGDLLMEQSSRIEDPVDAKAFISDAVVYYERAVDLALDCVETAATYGSALISLGLYDLAEAALTKASKIPDSKAVHPFVNHIGIKSTAGTKDELIANAKLRIKADLLYIDMCREDQRFIKVLKLINNPKVQAHTVLNATSMLAQELKHSDRAKLLFSEVVLELLRSRIPLSNVPSDEEVDLILQSALSRVQDLAAALPDSLPISLCHAKLQMTLGFFDATEKEYFRALNIANPLDPRYHDIPLGHTKGVKCSNRVQTARDEVICGLMALQVTIEEHFDNLTEEQKARFLSIRVDRMLEHNENVEMAASVYEAVQYYKANMSSVFWRCSFCESYVASTPEEFLLHVLKHSDSDALVAYDKLIEKLVTCNHMSNDELQCDLYLAVDEDGHEIFCIKSLGCLFKGIAGVVRGRILETPSSDALASFVHELSTLHSEDPNAIVVIEKLKSQLGVLPESEMDGISPDVAIANFTNQLSTVDNEDASTFAPLETLWINVLKVCAIDKHEAFLALIATIKWEEMKKMIEEQIVNAKIPDPDSSPEHETVLQTPEMKENLVGAPRPCHHAFRYGHHGLHRRLSAINALTSPNIKKMVEEEAIHDPYDNPHGHMYFAEKAPHPHRLHHLVLCSACYFEKGRRLWRFKQIVHHFGYVHGGVGVKCQICSLRFVTANALAYHMDYCHHVNHNR